MQPAHPLLAGAWLRWPLIALALAAWIATPVILGRIGGLAATGPQVVAGLAGLFGFALALWIATRRGVEAAAGRLLARMPLPSMAAILIGGVALRAVWALVFPAEPTSDGAIYLGLAQRMLDEGHYVIDGHRAYWPPGYPFYLLPWLAILPAKLAVPLSQIALFVVSAIGVERLGRRLADADTGRLGALFVALWPTLFAMCSTPEKEALVVALLPWITLGVFHPARIAQLAAGIGLGWACLTQPAFMLMIPLVVLVIALAQNGRLVRSLLLVCGVLLAVAPWSARNHAVLGAFVPISTNGGDNFYRANNPIADGGYMERGEVALPRHDELAMDRLGKELGLRWVRENPTDFAMLALEKQLRFMGDDSSGVFFSLKRGGGTDSAAIYTLAKLASNAWWLLAWLVVAATCLSRREGVTPLHFVSWFWLYLFVLHSVFESNGKYHIPALWALCLLLAQALVALRTPQPAR